MTRDKLAALDRAALRKLIADTAADLSAQKELWTAGDLAEALIATGKLVLIDDGAVERVARSIATFYGDEDIWEAYHGDATAALSALGVK
jgi:hypothetical protein